MKRSLVLALTSLALVVPAASLLPVSTAMAGGVQSTDAATGPETAGPETAGPLSVSLVQTFKQNDQGGGVVTFTNCPSSCTWADNYMGYASTQRWGQAAEIGSEIPQSFAGLNSAAAGSPVELGVPFVATHFGHVNIIIRGDAPTAVGIQTLLTVQPPVGSPAVFSMRGPNSWALQFLESDNQLEVSECDPDIQVSTTPCDDFWRLLPKTATTVASGVTWHFTLLGWGEPDGSFTDGLSTEERRSNTKDIYGKLTIDVNQTSSVLSVDGAEPVLTMTTTPVPQTGGTVTFTDNGSPLSGCIDVPVDTTTGTTTCTPTTPAPGAHSYGGSFDGSFGYAASAAAPVPHDVVSEQTVDFTAPGALTYGTSDVQLAATASSGLPVTFASTTPTVCTTTPSGSLHVAGAGPCTVTASQAGDATYSPAEKTQTFEISKANLTVTADDKTRAYGAPNPALTATVTGFVNGDDSSVVSGTPGLSTTATTDSPPGTYTIDVSLDGLSATDYDFTAMPGTLTINPPADAFASCEPGAPVPTGYQLLQGTAGNNLLLGTSGHDLIRAGAGNDLIAGAGGNDIICAGAGNDISDGGNGDDLIDGGTGIDFLSGGAGTDRGRDEDRLTFRTGFETFN
jgi:Ca2+-binding RTX toxin-like protein